MGNAASIKGYTALCMRPRPFRQKKHKHTGVERGGVRRERGIWHGPLKSPEWRRVFGRAPGD